jgi:hypothetical protein
MIEAGQDIDRYPGDITGDMMWTELSSRAAWHSGTDYNLVSHNKLKKHQFRYFRTEKRAQKWNLPIAKLPAYQPRAATRQKYSSLRTNQHPPSVTSQPNRLKVWKHTHAQAQLTQMNYFLKKGKWTTFDHESLAFCYTHMYVPACSRQFEGPN